MSNLTSLSSSLSPSTSPALHHPHSTPHSPLLSHLSTSNTTTTNTPSSFTSFSSISIKLLRLTPPQCVSQVPFTGRWSLPSSESTSATTPPTIPTTTTTTTVIPNTSVPFSSILPSTTFSHNDKSSKKDASNFISSTSTKNKLLPAPFETSSHLIPPYSPFVPLCTLPRFLSSECTTSDHLHSTQGDCASSQPSSHLHWDSTSTNTDHLQENKDPFEFYPVDPTMVLPSSFGNIYLGETLSFLLILSNPSLLEPTSTLFKPKPKHASPFHLTIELQTSSLKQVIYQNHQLELDLVDHHQHPLPHAFQCILHHDMMELGTHILIIQLNASSDSMSMKTNSLTPLKKFYKFQVLNPFQLKIKKHVLTSPEFKVMLEFSLTNLTDQTLVMGPLHFVPSTTPTSPHFQVTAMMSTQALCTSPLSSSMAEEMHEDPYLYPTESLHGVWMITTGDVVPLYSPTSPPVLGHFHWTWTRDQGHGRLTTPPLPWPSWVQSVPMAPFSLRPLVDPSQVTVYTPFTVTFQCIYTPSSSSIPPYRESPGMLSLSPALPNDLKLKRYAVVLDLPEDHGSGWTTATSWASSSNAASSTPPTSRPSTQNPGGMTKVKFLHAFPYFIPPFEPCPGTSTSSFRSLFQLQGVALVAGLHRLPPFLLQEWDHRTGSPQACSRFLRRCRTI
ncbi:hypothetical protein HMI55_006694 [Coelomomyces lativittatus]|nr:hypothetical protein HMI55_006694 [Coelomomyces lativittatus]